MSLKYKVVGLSVENRLFEEIEKRRDRVSRSRFVTDILQEAFKNADKRKRDVKI